MHTILLCAVPGQHKLGHNDVPLSLGKCILRFLTSLNNLIKIKRHLLIFILLWQLRRVIELVRDRNPGSLLLYSGPGILIYDMELL
jgi:hypothetical protein